MEKQDEMILKQDSDNTEELIISSNKKGFGQVHILLNTINNTEKLVQILNQNAQKIMSLKDIKQNS